MRAAYHPTTKRRPTKVIRKSSISKPHITTMSHRSSTDRRLDHSSASANNANRKSRAFQSAWARSSIENGDLLGVGSLVRVASHVTRSAATNSAAALKRTAKYDNARGHVVFASSSLRRV